MLLILDECDSRFLPLPRLRLGETIIAKANAAAETTTIEAPMGKSEARDNKNPTKQLTMPIIGENITIFLKS